MKKSALHISVDYLGIWTESGWVIISFREREENCIIQSNNARQERDPSPTMSEGSSRRVPRGGTRDDGSTSGRQPREIDLEKLAVDEEEEIIANDEYAAVENTTLIILSLRHLQLAVLWFKLGQWTRRKSLAVVVWLTYQRLLSGRSLAIVLIKPLKRGRLLVLCSC